VLPETFLHRYTHTCPHTLTCEHRCTCSSCRNDIPLAVHAGAAFALSSAPNLCLATHIVICLHKPQLHISLRRLHHVGPLPQLCAAPLLDAEVPHDF